MKPFYTVVIVLLAVFGLLWVFGYSMDGNPAVTGAQNPPDTSVTRNISGVKFTFVQIPGGSFEMGSNEKNQNDEKPIHNVKVKAFKMQTTEVTVGQFRAFVSATGYETALEKYDSPFDSFNPMTRMLGKKSWKNPHFTQTENHPVVCVRWNDAQAFIEWLNRSDPDKGYRLPSAAEWEYACRAGTVTKFYTGDSVSDLARAGWYIGNSDGSTHPVGQKVANNFGLYDMHGNAYEWCQDWYHYSYDGAPNDGSAWESSNPSDMRALRGGSWQIYPYSCRSARNDGCPPLDYNNTYGFRLVCR